MVRPDNQQLQHHWCSNGITEDCLPAVEASCAPTTRYQKTVSRNRDRTHLGAHKAAGEVLSLYICGVCKPPNSAAVLLTAVDKGGAVKA